MESGERVPVEQMLVHNLKAPLTGLIATLEMLHDGDFGGLTAAQGRAVQAMQEQAGELARMIDDLLELGRTSSSAFSVTPVPVDVPAFLSAVIAAWFDRLPRLTSDVASELPAVVADPEVLRRVIDNVLMNVLVHAGPETTVTVRGLAVGDTIRFLVSDNGPGVPAGDHERVFDPFVTLSTGAHRSHGLGLAYCRAALAALGGTIHLVPVERGTTVAIDLPSAMVLTRHALEQDQ